MIVYRMKGDRLQDDDRLREKGKGVGLWGKGKGDSYCVL